MARLSAARHVRFPLDRAAVDRQMVPWTPSMPVRVAHPATATMAFSIKVNGRVHLVDADGGTPLPWMPVDGAALRQPA